MTATRIRRPDTAFSLAGSTRRKRPRVEDGTHLKWIRTLSCLVTGRKDGIEAAHVRYPDPRYGKLHTGLGEKPSDKWTVPLHRDVHREQHQDNEREWWTEKRIDPVAIAAALWGATGDDELGELILEQARNDAKRRA
jgi:hypothetical protein